MDNSADIPEFQRDLPQKIALFGLGNVGKTSIIKTLMYEFDAFSSLLPTKGVDRTNLDFLGKEVLIWDFGGQETYREIYLARPVMYFQGIRYLYYVVDAQDSGTIQQSIDYFLKLFALTMEYSTNVQVFIFFHKIDPEYKGPINFQDVENKFIEAVIPAMQLKNITPVVFYTSIFKPMTVISAFSQPLLGNQTIYDTMCDAIEGFCWENDLPFSILFVDNFELGSYYGSQKLFNFINTKIQGYLDWLDDVDEVPMYRMGKFQVYTQQFAITVGETDFMFNFAIGVDPLSAPEDIDDLFQNMDEFTEGLKKILVNSEIIRTGELRMDDIGDADRRWEFLAYDEDYKLYQEFSEEERQMDINRFRELEILENQRMKFQERMERMERMRSGHISNEEDAEGDVNKFPEFESHPIPDPKKFPTQIKVRLESPEESEDLDEVEIDAKDLIDESDIDAEYQDEEYDDDRESYIEPEFEDEGTTEEDPEDDILEGIESDEEKDD